MMTYLKYVSRIITILSFIYGACEPVGASLGHNTVHDITQQLTLKIHPHDVKTTVYEDKNITAVLEIRGLIAECINITFSYNPPDPTIEPFDDVHVCADPPRADPPRTHHHIRPQHRIVPWSSVQDVRGIRELVESRRVWMGEEVERRREGIGKEVGGRRVLIGEEEPVQRVMLEVTPRRVGKTLVQAHSDAQDIDVSSAFLRASVVLDPGLDTASAVLGWVYTVAWDVSFLPQLVLNFQRKSVVGLSLDNVSLNVLGYFCYTVFNVALYAVPYIQDQFAARHPTSVNHVRLNDLGFSCYALLVQLIICVQCVVYKRAPGQRMSVTCGAIVGTSFLAIAVCCVLAATQVIWWLDVVYVMADLKLIISVLKYIPQLWVNYKRKGTGGVSKLGMQLDFLGGSMSLTQMFLLAANNDDWLSLFADFTKFGLGTLTVVYDCLFFVQHYVIYRNRQESVQESQSDEVLQK